MRQNLKNARLEAKLTQQELADYLHISRNYYSQIETGAKSPSFRAALAIKLALHETSDSIFDNDASIKTVRGRPR